MEWLNRAIILTKEDKEEMALDVIYDYMDEAFYAGRFEQVDKELSEIDIDNLDLDLILGIATTTSWAKDKLKNRDSFMKKCYNRFKDDKDVDANFQGLM